MIEIGGVAKQAHQDSENYAQYNVAQKTLPGLMVSENALAVDEVFAAVDWFLKFRKQSALTPNRIGYAGKNYRQKRKVKSPNYLQNSHVLILAPIRASAQNISKLATGLNTGIAAIDW